jgi:hypothetical protein
MHELIEPLAALVGTWRGSGRGEYPTIDDFGYVEEIELVEVGKPFLSYVQRTKSPEGAPMHGEAGYLRAVGGDRLELIVAAPNGIMEIHEGTYTVDGGVLRIELGTVAVPRTATSKRVDEVTRTIVVDGDTLTYDLAMAAVGVGLTHHLTATLQRAG